MSARVGEMTQSQLAREVAANRNTPHMAFLGAGASVSSGVKSAGLCIQDWKREVFRTSNAAHQEATDVEIQQWCDEQPGFPKAGTDAEYGFYVAQCYPSGTGRRAYFDRLRAASKPGVGYRLFALLARDGLFQAAWTTNFDGLTARAASAFAELEVIEAGLDTVRRARKLLCPGRLLCVAMHGDYRYDDLKNLPRELQAQDETLRAVFMHRARDYPVIVLGYSGRDHSIMDMLADAYRDCWNGRLFWCGYQREPNDRVNTLLEGVRKSGAEAFYVGGSNFDEVMTTLARASLSRDRIAEMETILTAEPDRPQKDTRAAVAAFAREYAAIRSSMKRGDLRTVRMEELVSTRLRTMGLTAWGLLPELTRMDAQPGETLAATILLQQRADPDYLKFLAWCLTQKPFVGYHAAVALRFAGSALNVEKLPLLRKVIGRAFDYLGAERRHTDRGGALQSALAVIEERMKAQAARTGHETPRES